MGALISRRQFLSHKQLNYARPLVFCCDINGLTEDSVPLNVPLARRLAGIPAPSRSRRLEECLVDCLESLPNGVAIRDFDVLFNPSYEVDIVTLLVSAYRRHSFSVIWPGTLDGDELVYAEEGCADYRRYDINRYDITCIF
jgi:hypothetical protein